jgi:steroid delta-isomerase-like uncharacterized protein
MATTEQTQGLDAAFVESFAHRWLEAWNAHDGNAVAALCTEDIVYDDPALEQTARSRPEVAAFVERSSAMMPDYQFDEPAPPAITSDGRMALVPWRMRGTFAGRLDPPGFAPTCQKLEILGIDQWEFRDGLVCRYRAYWDMLAVARQIGAVPEPGTGAEKVGVFMQRIKARMMRRRAR